MKATLDNRWLLIERTESDKPIVLEPYPRPKVTRQVYNSWRKDYHLCFATEDEAKKALVKVNEIGDFDRAAAWLDKQ